MKKETLLLKIYAMTLTAIVMYFIISGFTSDQSMQRFEEINVERINIVEPNGDLKMVISNSKRQHPGMFDGVVLFERPRPAGIIFFNEEKDEVGGLIYQGNKEEGSSWVLSVDQYKNDQVMQMRYTDSKGKSSYGLHFWDRDRDLTMPKLARLMDSLQALGLSREQILARINEMSPEKPISAPRLFIGKGFEKEAGLFIKDEYGIDRLRFYVDLNNQPKIEVLDDKGKVIRSLATD